MLSKPITSSRMDMRGLTGTLGAVIGRDSGTASEPGLHAGSSIAAGRMRRAGVGGAEKEVEEAPQVRPKGGWCGFRGGCGSAQGDRGVMEPAAERGEGKKTMVRWVGALGAPNNDLDVGF